jgi:hypothetical protein
MPEHPWVRAASLGAAFPGTLKPAPCMTKSHSESPVSTLGCGPVQSTSTLAAPSDAPSAPNISCPGTSGAGVSRGTTTGQGEPRRTMAQSPAFTTDDATRDTYGDVAGRAAGRWTIGGEEVQLLSPSTTFLSQNSNRRAPTRKPKAGPSRAGDPHHRSPTRTAPPSRSRQLGWPSGRAGPAKPQVIEISPSPPEQHSSHIG